MNLLPLQEQRRLRRETIMRLAIIALASVFALEFIAVLLLAPTYIVTQAQREIAEQVVATMKQRLSGKGDADAELHAFATEIKAYLSATDRPASDVIKTVLDPRPDEVRVSSFTFSRSAASGALQLSGVGGTREGLLEYQKRLRAVDGIKDAKYTENFLTKKVDIPYTLVITLK